MYHIPMETKTELLSHMKDLARRSYDQGIYTFSGFLSPAEYSDVLGMGKDLSYAGISASGGMDGCERVMVRFGKCGYVQEFPIECLVIEPLMRKFAEDLSHRDFLGALMNLGIERSLLGDIIIRDMAAYLFCDGKIADYIAGELTRVRHTTVKVAKAGRVPEDAQPVLEEVNLQVSSPRADGTISKLFNLSRNDSNELFRAEKVFINGRVAHSNSSELKMGDVVSVRGFGKFVFDGEAGETRKGRIRVTVRKYV